METFSKIVTELPLVKLSSKSGSTDLSRKQDLTRTGLTEILKQSPVQFVIAEIGNPLKWIPIEKCFLIWKSKIKMNVVENLEKIELETFPNKFAYIASEWTGKTENSIVLLEKVH